MDKDSLVTLQELRLMQKNNVGKKKSAKERRKETSKTLLKGIPSGAKCSECKIDCIINRTADVEFWGNNEGPEKAPYNRDNCPKQGRLQKHKIKMKKR